MNKTLFALVAEDLTHLDGPMGSEFTIESTVSTHYTIDGAKKAADKDYGSKVPWTDNVSREDDILRSEDLKWIMYHIRKVEVQE